MAAWMGLGARGRAPARIGTVAVPLLLALGCGTTYVPADGSDGDGASDGADGDTDGSGGSAPSGTGGAADSSGGTSSAGGTTGGATSTGGNSSGSGGEDGSGGDGSGGDAGEGYDCNTEHILCQPLVPPEPCPQGQVYSVQDECHGACVPIEQCLCSTTQDCPDPNGTEEYTCHGNTDRCGPWVR